MGGCLLEDIRGNTLLNGGNMTQAMSALEEGYKELESKLHEAEQVLKMYNDLARTFIDKVDTGRAKSKETYVEFKRILPISVEYFKK